MANANTKLYASQGNGGKATVKISEINAAASAATTTTAGTVKQAAHIANATVPFADLTAAANAYNALLAALQTAGQMAAS
jgi:hypothetical protein